MTARPERAISLLQRARLLAGISACFFCIAVVGVGDALQEMARRDFNHIDMLAGQSVIMNGMFPAGVSDPKNIEITIDGTDDLSFAFSESYKGFWLGAQMWRGTLTAQPSAAPGKATLTVAGILPDLPEGGTGASGDSRISARPVGVNPVASPGLQNPALVHTITLWESAAAMRAAEHSWFKRNANLPPFSAAGIALAVALLLGLGHFFSFGAAEKELTGRRIFFIHGVKRGDKGVEAIFSLAGHTDIAVGSTTTLRTLDWKDNGRGVLTETAKGKGRALFDSTVKPRYGWLVECHSRVISGGSTPLA